MTTSELAVLIILGAALPSRPGELASDPEVECGLHCAEVVTRVFDRDAQSLRERLQGAPPMGYTLADLREGVESVGLQTLLVKTSSENLTRRPPPFAAIAHVDEGRHFVVLYDIDPARESACVFDPKNLVRTDGLQEMDLAALETRWDGVALLVSPHPLVPEEELPWTTMMWLRAAGLAVGVIGLAVAGGWATRSALGRSRRH